MNKKIVLTGIKPTGYIHLGNYVGAIKPALNLAQQDNLIPIYFIADYHALTSINNPSDYRRYIYSLAATWLSLGLNPDKVIFYKQSDLPEVFELTWILSCLTPKGLMNRAHAYKSKVDRNIERGLDIDNGINMGLYTYPILMAADILLFNADIVPVGKDQVQHIEIARDIALQFNKTYGEIFNIPNYLINEETSVLPGIDGRKMSKSYNNTIPLFESPDKLKKQIFKIKTDSSLPGDPKDPDNSILFSIYKEFATQDQILEMEEKFRNGIGWGQVKQELFDVINNYLEEPRKKYMYYIERHELIDSILKKGAEKARELSSPFLKKIRKAIGAE